MKTRPSKIDGIGIVDLRCEICHGNIMDNDGVTPLLSKDGMHFVHTTCYKDNTSEYILARMHAMKAKTQNDAEMAKYMESSDEGTNKKSVQ